MAGKRYDDGEDLVCNYCGAGGVAARKGKRCVQFYFTNEKGKKLIDKPATRTTGSRCTGHFGCSHALSGLGMCKECAQEFEAL